MSNVVSESASAFLEPAPTFQLKWGASGTGLGQFTNLEFLAADSQRNIYASDAYDADVPYDPVGNHRVQKFSPDGTYLTGWGSLGTGPGEFTRISGIAVDSADVVYVTDDQGGVGNQRVQRFTSSGVFIDAPPWLNFNNLAFVLFGTTGDIFGVSHDPAFVRHFDSVGNVLGQFGIGALPRSGIVDSSGNLNIALNRGLGPVERYSPTGSLLTTINMSASQLAIDSNDNLYGTNEWYFPSGGDVVRKYSSSGVLLTEWGGTGAGDGQFQSPTGLVVTSDFRVFVGENIGRRIQRFGTNSLPVPASKDECKNGGWKHLYRSNGSPFKNQGDCVSYVNTGR